MHGYKSNILSNTKLDWYFFKAPDSYKNVTDVVETCHQAGISKKCIKLRPVAVIKGWWVSEEIIFFRPKLISDVNIKILPSVPTSLC